MYHSFAFEHIQNECRIHPIYHILCQCLCGPFTSWHISRQCNLWPIAYLPLFMYKGEGSVQLMTRLLFTFSFSSSICDEMSLFWWQKLWCWFWLVMYYVSEEWVPTTMARVSARVQHRFCLKMAHYITMGATQILLKNGTVTILFKKFNSAI